MNYTSFSFSPPTPAERVRSAELYWRAMEREVERAKERAENARKAFEELKATT